jgi:hypothetical protein
MKDDRFSKIVTFGQKDLKTTGFRPKKSRSSEMGLHEALIKDLMDIGAAWECKEGSFE